MSKLSHSNDESMRRIEFSARGIVKYKLPALPKCEHKVKRRHPLVPAHQCTRYGRYHMPDGRFLCKRHMEQS